MNFDVSIPSTNTCFSVLGYWYTCPIQASDPFLNKKFKDFSRTYSHFSRSPFSAKKSLVLPQHEGLSVFAPLSLEFYLNYRVNIEIQGFSRPWIFLLKYCQYTNWVGLSTLWKGSCVKGMCIQYWKSPSLKCFWVYLNYLYVLVYWTTLGIFEENQSWYIKTFLSPKE